MTVSLDVDAYLEPQRLSFSSPPGSDLNQETPPVLHGGSEESYPVFSPPPYVTKIIKDLLNRFLIFLRSIK